MLWLKSLLFLLAAPGTVCVLVPWVLARFSHIDLGPWRWAGMVLLAPGGAALLWCFRDFVVKGHGTPNPRHPPGTLVVNGLYRYTRNPMYVAVVTIVAGEAVVFESPILLGWAALVWLVFHLFVTLYEEPKLRSLFGEQFDAYRSRVRRWI